MISRVQKYKTTSAIAHFISEFFPLYGIVADFKDDLRVVVDVVEGKVCQGVLVIRIIFLVQGSEDRNPM